MAGKTDAAIQHVQRYGVAGLDESGLIFEPRALWSVGRFDTAAATPNAKKYARGEIQLPRQHFLNGARWPIVVTRVSLAAINYLLMQNNPTVAPASTNQTFRNAASVLASIQFMLSVPRRQFYSKRPITSLALAPRPTGTPTMRGTTQSYASSIWGASRLEFDKPLRMPHQGAIEVALGSPTGYSAESQDTAWTAAVHVEELGGIFPGSSRDKSMTLKALSTTPPPIFKPDSFGASNNNAAPALATFPAEQVFTQTEFTKQRPSRSGGSAFTAISVAIDQCASDDAMQLSVVDGVAGSFVCPLSLRTPVRVYTKGGASGTDWWREGAPLGLVFTDVTPALVYDLPVPITLNPGDGLSVVLQTPIQTTSGEVPITPIYQIGFAANGFAVIEG